MPLIRASHDGDLQAITRIYAHHVLHGTGTFETTAPTLAEMASRRGDVLSKGLPWLVMEGDQGAVVGFAYANWFKPRAAFRFSVEDSIYMDAQCVGQGWGRLLLAELLKALECAGVRKVMALIGDSANLASVGLHRGLGFEPAGVIASCGWKFNRWLDLVLMQKSLGQGDGTPPQETESPQTSRR